MTVTAVDCLAKSCPTICYPVGAMAFMTMVSCGMFCGMFENQAPRDGECGFVCYVFVWLGLCFVVSATYFVYVCLDCEFGTC